MSKYLEAVTSAFRDLIDTGQISIGKHVYSEELFGNTVVYLSGCHFLMRMSVDRGESYAEAASSFDPDAWVPLSWALIASGVSNVTEGELSPGEAAKLVGAHLSTLESALSMPRYIETRKRIAEIDKHKMEEVMKWKPLR